VKEDYALQYPNKNSHPDLTAELEKQGHENISENFKRELNTFFMLIDDVFFSIDHISYKLIHMSHGCEKLCGYTETELKTDFSLLSKLYHPDDTWIIDVSNRDLANGETTIIQYRIVRKDGVVRWVESKIMPTLDEYGKLIRIDGLTRDITDKKNREIEHRRIEKRFRQIVENAQEGIWTIDENNKTNFVNKMLCDMLGYSAEEMMGKDHFHFMHEDCKDYAKECIARRRNGIKEELIICYIAKCGKHVWASISANPIIDEEGKYGGALAMVTDITERLSSERSLKKSEANLRAIFENTDIAFVLFNPDLKVISSNSQAKDFYAKYVNKKLKQGANALDYFPKHKRQLFSLIADKVKKHEVVSYETNYHLKNEVSWYDVKWAGVLNEQSEHIGILLTFRDITDKKVLELEREKITADLVQRNKAQEQFNYIVSHNLRAPVANITGLLELYNDPDNTEQDKKFVMDGISSSIKRLDSVIIDMNQVLQVKELISETREETDLVQLVKDIKISISNIIEKEKVLINCYFDATVLLTVRSYLYSVFYNLILNSIKYRKCGVSPVITITSALCENNMQITFTDNGKGIDLATNGKQLFRLYKRFDTSVEGKGLGLFMVKTQVESLGGTIEVSSELNKGTEFTITIPV
jgi:PAS domain S-box-containing protein